MVVRLVFDPLREDVEPVTARRERAGQGAERRIVAPGDLCRRTRRVVERDHLDTRQLAQKSLALREHATQRPALRTGDAKQTVMYRAHHFAYDR